MTAAGVDQEVILILKESYEEAKRLLKAHRSTLDQIAQFLIERETITGKEFMKIFNRVKGIEEPEAAQQSADAETSEEKTASEAVAEEKNVETVSATVAEVENAETASEAVAEEENVETVTEEAAETVEEPSVEQTQSEE